MMIPVRVRYDLESIATLQSLPENPFKTRRFVIFQTTALSCNYGPMTNTGVLGYLNA